MENLKGYMELQIVKLFLDGKAIISHFSGMKRICNYEIHA